MESDDDVQVIESVPVTKNQSVITENVNAKPPGVKQKNQNSNGSGAIIVLDDDDESEDVIPVDISDLRKDPLGGDTKSHCVNLECNFTSAKVLHECPPFVLHYYKLEVKPKTQYVCDRCYDKVRAHYEGLAGMALAGKPLFSFEQETRNPFVEISDSEEECASGGIPVRDYPQKSLKEEFGMQLYNVMNELFAKYAIQNQIYDNDQILLESAARVKRKIEFLEKEHNEISAKTDKIRTDIYNYFPPSYTSVLPLDIKESIDYTVDETIRFNNLRGLNKVQPPLPSPDVQPVEVEVPPDLPPLGFITNPEVQIGDFYYAVRQSMYGAWGKAKIMEILPPTTMTNSSGEVATFSNYKVKFESRSKTTLAVKNVTGRQIACYNPSPIQLPFGTRVIAIYKDNENFKRDAFYCGIVAESPKSMNRYSSKENVITASLCLTHGHAFRYTKSETERSGNGIFFGASCTYKAGHLTSLQYLIFFDDGYTQYVEHSRVRLVTEWSKQVWEDIQSNSKKFFKQYLEKYPERSMVKLSPGLMVKCEYKGKWSMAKVLEVDVSLAKMSFEQEKRTEWIYRGSSRFDILYSELQAAINRQDGLRHRIGATTQFKKDINRPYVEYTRGSEDEATGTTSVQSPPPNRAVAKKSTRPLSNLPMPVVVPEQSQGAQGRIVYYTAKVPVQALKYREHNCSPKCLPSIFFAMKGYNPLSKPLLSGWNRQLAKAKGKKIVIYKSPCGRRLRSMPELHQYLQLTKCSLGVDCFDFDTWVHCLAEFVLDRTNVIKEDISKGVENVPVPCVNYVDFSLPDYSTYSVVRLATEGVNLNLDPEFLCGCDCEDDCQNKSKCACWKLTMEGARTCIPNQRDEDIGYVYKRLPEAVSTGVYECNSRCKCAATCLNRVAQHPLEMKLQLFKTASRGWGLRCLNDIPQGAFICIYAGNLLTEQKANAGGAQYGDEYFAELDYIEVVEKIKEGYETDVVPPPKPVPKTQTTETSKALTEQDEEDEDDPEEPTEFAEDSDEEFTPSGHGYKKFASKSFGNEIQTRLRKRNKTSSVDSNEKSVSETSNVSKSEKKHGNSKKNSDSEKSNESTKNDDSTKCTDPVKNDESTKNDKSAPTADKSDNSNDDDDYITISDDEEVREPSSFAPEHNLESDERKHRSVRKMFGEDEYCYVMDAKSIGNLGRYLNHSCNPNVFVQNVFVDTHDVRFPWVAFFALTFIRGGTELTWNYNYDVNSVPGKTMYCYCGAQECRGRLL